MKLNRLFLDIDADSSWLWRTGPVDDLLPLVRMEAKRLGGMYPLGDIAVIKRSDNGWHIKYPNARLTKDEEIAIMWASRGHRGHIAFSDAVRDTTIRVSKKRGKYSHRPWFVEVITVG